ncbi:hypothetical protein GCM10009129_06610 [Psychrobacter aestuarii]|uniref:Uncharacterized protein n=2 Tax=Psychrobacter aestuarii TaxID=556327 RepID=A0ABN0VMP9_9GAMM
MKQKELLSLREKIAVDYQPIKVAELSMRFLLQYSAEIPYCMQSDLHSLIAMDIGAEFVLSQETCLKIIDDLLAQLVSYNIE